ncbi:class I adenylate-forming enzyme family protein [Amycolatopsis pithecellobii]|uniref:AMP-binding protein n=1 Tax=Amycolatopsis pithecellobii TaxID=664692 RepID=A0A6N7Z3V3_9PSEU|nr:AMP-binding protein [Amycolatopsis pithecellobii]MTD54991.1 AMP-binding protein [Amycolatopsis pithecellobii]
MPITLPAPVPGSLDYPEVPVGAIVAGAAARWGERVAYRHHDRQLTFTEVYRAACRFANALRANGIAPGDTVAIHAPNCLAYPVAYYGIQLAGATFVPANPLLPPADLAAQLADSGAVAAVTFGKAAQTLAAIQDRTAVRLVVTVGDDFDEFHAGQPETPPDVPIDVHRALAHLAYTGGTTGRSKGVELPHRNIVVNALQYTLWNNGTVPVVDPAGGLTLDQVGSADEWPVRLGTGVIINLTPWFHAMGIISGVNMSMLTGTTVALQDGFEPRRYLAEAERLRITSIGGAPALFAGLVACPDLATRDLSSVRTLGSGAAPMPHETTRALHDRFPDATIVEGYGLTEVTLIATGGPAFRSGIRKPGTVGVPVPGTEVKIVDADGEPLPAGEKGEVCVRGPQVMPRYHNRPEETDATLVDGWLHTGDIGVLDEDGYLSIVDRKKDMLLYKGYNVYPRELEELLMAQPGVRQAAVVGRHRTDVGELPVAFVVRTDEAVTDESLLAAVNDNVLPYKRIRELYFVDEIPVSAAGKVLKRELRARL